MVDPNSSSDTPRVDVRDEAQCRYWCRHFGVRPKDLKRAIRTVGDHPTAVEKFLSGVGKMGPNDASHWRATSGL